MSKRILALSICFVSSVSLVVLLDIYARSLQNRDNAFVRQFPPHPVVPLRVHDFGYNSFYYSASNSQFLFFGNINDPTKIMRLSADFKDTQLISLNNMTSERIVQGMNNVKVDGSKIYILQGLVHDILEGNTSSKTIDHAAFSMPFDLSADCGKGNFIVRTYSLDKKQYVLSKINFDSADKPSATFILDKQQGDGVFSTDGTLSIDPATRSVTYVHYYSNKFYKLDSNLNLVLEGHTIDTNYHQNLKVATIKTTGEKTLSEPAKIINKYTAANSKWLFVNSELKASNETQVSTDDNSVIDVYSLKDGKYRFSFYLPDYKNISLTGFHVTNNTLLASYDRYVFFYSVKF